MFTCLTEASPKGTQKRRSLDRDPKFREKKLIIVFARTSLLHVLLKETLFQGRNNLIAKIKPKL